MKKGRKFSKWVENTVSFKFVLDRGESVVGKGENAGCHHFLLFPMFSKTVLSGKKHLQMTDQISICL